MLRKLVFFIIISWPILMSGQMIYSDSFNDTIHKTSSSVHYKSQIKQNALVITGNGTAKPYHSVTYSLHQGETNRLVNLSSNPKLYLKAKGTGMPKLRVDLVDSKGYATNLNAKEITLDEDYKIFTINYANSLQDGAYSGPCVSHPCIVNATKIQALQFMVNDAIGKYNGEIAIEWLSFGAPLEMPPHEEPLIRYNQLGYLLNRPKILSLHSAQNFEAIPYTIKDASGTVVMQERSKETKFWKDAQQYVALIDISSLNTEGTYSLHTQYDTVVFEIKASLYDALGTAALNYFYHNRASIETSSNFAGKWGRNAGHPDNEVYIHHSASSKNRPAGTIISAPKGWYDAGDFNKYVVNSGISTFTLLAAFEHYSSYYKTKSLNIPESSNNLPDILDEALWNIEWLLAMQDKKSQGGDGGVYHKLSSLKFSGRIVPEAHKAKRYVFQKTTAATLNFAAVMAVASRIFKKLNKKSYHKLFLEASVEAYQWAKNNPDIYYVQPKDVETGTYKNKSLEDEFLWAATELYITTEDKLYRKDIDVTAIKLETPEWKRTSPLALISVAHHSKKIKSKFKTEHFNTALINLANTIKNNIQSSVMRISLETKDYEWGSNANVCNQIIILIRAYELTKDKSYLNASYTATDYLFGRNGVGKSFVTGFGVNQVRYPHHRISDADGITDPIPGMLVGGPHTFHPDQCSYPNLFPASSYIDDWCSYSTNEVTINWNAPLAYIINALTFYQHAKVEHKIIDKN